MRGEEETISVVRDIPKLEDRDKKTTIMHKTDIMSCVYDFKTNLIFTGSHDGELLAWHFETGFTKYSLHDKDKTCTSKDYVKDSKSVDCLIIMQKERLLLSASADGLIRFWDLNDLSVENPRVYTMNAFNFSFEEDQLTSVIIAREHVFPKDKKYEKSSDRILTSCTGGKIKCWDISKTNFRTDKDPAETMRISWYIQAHRKIAGSISSLTVVENYKSDRFVISASTDNNILVHRISTGVKIG